MSRKQKVSVGDTVYVSLREGAQAYKVKEVKGHLLTVNYDDTKPQVIDVCMVKKIIKQ